MRILRVIASVDPSTGGPVAGLSAVTPALARLGHETEFLTADDATKDYLKDFFAPVHAAGPGQGSYGYAPRLRNWLEKNINRFDAVIVHGLWQYFGQVVRAVSRDRAGTSYFVFPHGMLDPSLKKAYPVHHVKKWLYWIAVESRVLRDARAVFFTCEEERRLARTTFPGYVCNERVIAYGTALPISDPAAWHKAWEEKFPAIAGRPYLLFLGRLHSKKGVDLLLRAYGELFKNANPRERAALPDLVLAGPCSDDRFLHMLHALAQTHGIESRVHWTGMLTGDAKWGALAGAEAFVLPSHQENFGIAVAEALACGTPVLISDRVNIWREVSASNAALVEPPTDQGTTQLLRRWISLDSTTRQTMSTAAHTCFNHRFEISGSAKNLADELSGLIARPISPA